MADHHLVHPDFEVRYGAGDVWMDFPNGGSHQMTCTGHDPTAEGRDVPDWEGWDVETLRKILWLEAADVSDLAGVEIRQGVTIGDPEKMRDQLVRELLRGPCTATLGARARLDDIHDFLNATTEA